MTFEFTILIIVSLTIPVAGVIWTNWSAKRLERDDAAPRQRPAE